MICANCGESFKMGGCAKGATSFDFSYDETLTFCGGWCIAQFKANNQLHKRTHGVARQTANGWTRWEGAHL